MVGPILLAAVEAAIEAARATGGLFDPTLGHELVRLGYDRSFEEMGDALPSPRRPGRRRRLAHDGRRPLRGRRHHARGERTRPGRDRKGMAVDASLGLLRSLGIERRS